MYVWLSCEELLPGLFPSESQAKIRVNGFAIVTYSAKEDVREGKKGTQVRAYVVDETKDKYILEFPQEVAVIDAPDERTLGRRVAVPKNICQKS